MLSRRLFLLGSLGFVVAPDAFARKKPRTLPQPLGPHSIARAAWPPAISPDFVGVVDRGYALISDQGGRMAIVDFKREQGPLVMGELSSVGKKIIDVALAPQRCYILAYQESGTDSNFALVIVNTASPQELSIAAKIPLPYFSEPVCIAASADCVCIAGTGSNGENLLAIYLPPGKRRAEGDSFSSVATMALDQPATMLSLQDRQLIVLQAGMPSQLDVIGLLNPRMPQRLKSIKLDGSYLIMSREHDVFILAGQRADKKYEAKLFSLKPALRLVSNTVLPLTELFDAAAQKGQFLLLGNQIHRQAVLPISYNKALQVTVGEPVLLPAGGKGGPASKARIAVSAREAYVASDWGGVQVLSIQRSGWQYVYSHTIPRMPAAAVAVAGNKVVLGGADLKLYDITDPAHPLLQDSTEIGSTVKSVVAIDERILCLGKESLSLRSKDKPGDVIATIRLRANALAYDAAQNQAFVIASKNKDSTVITPVRIADSLFTDRAEEINGSFSHLSASGGLIAVAGLSNVSVYAAGANGLELLGARCFPNFAIRDICLAQERLIITAVDQNLKGFFLVLVPNKTDLPTLGSVDLPQDAAAVAVAGNRAVVVGRTPEGKDIASVIDIGNSVAPKVITSFAVVEAAAAVTIADRLAVVAGRGLEILTLG